MCLDSGECMDQQIIAMQQWYQAPEGRLIASLEKQWMDKYLPNFFGQYALQLGGPSDLSLLAPSPIKRQFHVLPKVKCPEQKHSVEVDFAELAFAPNSIDLVVIDHLLEFVERPWQLLSQLYQCLAPHGHCVIMGFSPWSLWGAHRLIKRKVGAPWDGRFWSASRVCYWLQEIGYGVQSMQRYAYQGPIAHSRHSHVCTALEIVGQCCWPGLGGAYCIVAKKSISAITPIKASLWAKKQSLPGRCCPEPVMTGRHS